MDSLQATYRDEDDEEGEPAHGAVAASEAETIDPSKHASEPELEDESSEEPPSEETGKHRQKRPKIDENDDEEDDDDDDEGRGGGEGEVEEEEEEEEEEVASPKRRRRASLVVLDSGCEEQLGDKNRSASPPEMAISNGLGEANVSAHGMSKSSAVAAGPNSSNGKKSKKKSSSVWVTKTTRKGKKKNKGSNNGNHIAPVEETVLITPVTRFPDRNDDSPVMTICLSKVYKAEKVEVSNDRMSASSSKGYRMVRATRGVVGGAWYFEIKVEKLGETGHTRLGWSLEKGDLQAPVGYDGSSFGYRDIDGSKVHKAMREKYGEEGYKEGDVIGFYLNLPDGELYAPKPPQMVWYKGQRYVCAPDPKEGTPKVVPGSEISFFKNGVCQGIAFKDLHGGRYYPAASMYTLPNQPNCVVRFNFGPVFECFPDSFEGRPAPKPMIEVPYHGYDGSFENGGPTEQKDDQKLPEISNFRRLRY